MKRTRLVAAVIAVVWLAGGIASTQAQGDGSQAPAHGGSTQAPPAKAGADKKPAMPQKGAPQHQPVPAAAPGAESAAATGDRMTAATFDGLALRPIGPAVTSGRVVDIAVRPGQPQHLLRGVRVGRRLEDHQRRHHLDPGLRRRGLVLDRLRHASIRTTRSSSGSARARTTASAACRTATASTSPIDGGKTWKNMGLKDSMHIGKIVVDPRNSEASSTWPRRDRSGRRAATAASTRRPTAGRPGRPC